MQHAYNSIDLPLWPDRDDTSRSETMRVVFPKVATGERTAALVVFRGGGYTTNRGSGAGSAEWAAANGMVGVEVPYQVQSASGDGALSGAFPGAYDDAARAVRLVRAHADEWNVDAARVGVLGYSAGGHLAGLLSTQPHLRASPADTLAPRVSARPDFVVLAYPVVSFVEGYGPDAYAGTAACFFGAREVPLASRAQFSNELHVTPGHPPVFVWTTADDALVPAAHARLFAEACERAGVPVSYTLFDHGPHGMGLALDAPPDLADVGTWTRTLRAWLVARGVVSASATGPEAKP